MIVKTRHYRKGWAVLVTFKDTGDEDVTYQPLQHIFGNGFFSTRTHARSFARRKRAEGRTDRSYRVVRACVLFQTEP